VSDAVARDRDQRGPAHRGPAAARRARRGGRVRLAVDQRGQRPRRPAALPGLGGGHHRLEVGVGVAPIWTRTPAQLAMASATLQEATGAASCSGSGSATRPRWALARRRGPRPLTASRELLTILAAARGGGAERHPGRCCPRSGSGWPSPRPAADPPLPRRHGAADAGAGGTHADGVLLNWAGPAEVAEAAERVRDAARAAVTRPASRWRPTCASPCTGTADAARAALATQIGPTARCRPTPPTSSGRGSAPRARARQAHRDGGGRAGLAEALGDEVLDALGWAGAGTTTRRRAGPLRRRRARPPDRPRGGRGRPGRRHPDRRPLPGPLTG
jgi:alkanesulfonate monooxygenase SsuD/methylene tetrahydromethanopterin reductase-like flavin-dependent oxidoreductase (luciferase family)